MRLLSHFIHHAPRRFALAALVFALGITAIAQQHDMTGKWQTSDYQDFRLPEGGLIHYVGNKRPTVTGPQGAIAILLQVQISLPNVTGDISIIENGSAVKRMKIQGGSLIAGVLAFKTREKSETLQEELIWKGSLANGVVSLSTEGGKFTKAQAFTLQRSK